MNDLSTASGRHVAAPEPQVAGRSRPVWAHRKVASLLLERVAVGTIAVGLAAAVARGSQDWLLAAVPLVAGGFLLADTSALPRSDRQTSLRPLRRLLTVAGAPLLVLGAAGVFDALQLRVALASIGLVLAVPVGIRSTRLLRRAPRTTLLVGDRVAVRHLLAQWESRPEVRVVGICLTSTPDDAVDEPHQISGLPVLGDLDDVAVLAVESGIDQVVVAPGPVVTAYDVRRLSWALEDTDIELAVAAEVHGAVPRRIKPRLLGRRLLLAVRPARRPWAAVLVKESLDRVVAAVLLTLLAPVLLALVVLVRWDSPGPGIFPQVRAGKGGRPFTMYKLRTMAVDAEQRLAQLKHANEGAGPLFKMAFDPRVTRLGRMLRRTSLDELPQLWNVMTGRMSLIGPRPALPSEADEYDAWIRRRLMVKPGMTGLWQVSGRSRLRWHESVRLDLDYVDNWTLRGDLEIAGRTISAVARSDGAL